VRQHRPRGGGQAVVGDGGVDLLESAEEDVGVGAELGVVHQQDLLLGVGQHRLAHQGFVEVVVRHAALERHLGAAEKGLVGAVAVQRRGGVEAGEGRGPAPEGAAQADQVDVGRLLVAQAADQQRVGDDGHVDLLVEDGLRQRQAGRAGIQHDDIVFVDVLQSLARQLGFDLRIQHLAQLGRVAFVVLLHQVGAAVGAGQLAAGLQLLEVAADGLLTAVQQPAQRGDQHAAVFGQLLLDDRLAIDFQH